MCLIRVTKVDVQSLSRPDLLFFIPHPFAQISQCQIYVAFPGQNENIPHMDRQRYFHLVSRIPHCTSRLDFQRFSHLANVMFRHSKNFEIHHIHISCMTCYDNQRFFQLSRTPQAIFVVSLSKFQSNFRRVKYSSSY